MSRKTSTMFPRAFRLATFCLVAFGLFAIANSPRATAQQPASDAPAQAVESTPATAAADSDQQTAYEQAFIKMLSGATLEGSFTSTGGGRDRSRLSSEKYEIGQVRKIAGNLWLIPARVQYGGKDFTLPITVPIRWAGDTPVVMVDGLPGFDNMKARVLFYDNHYSGYWKHGDHGGNLFGTISHDKKPAAEADKAAAASDKSSSDAPKSGGNPPADKQGDK